jgi:hypothetical protein
VCTSGQLSLCASCTGVSGRRGSVRVSSLGGCYTNIAAVGEEPPAPSTNSTLRSFASFLSRPGKPLLR